MKIYNSLTKEVEEFKPVNEKEVHIYTCGPTVYNYAHIGNLRCYIMEDVLVKLLRYNGYNVKRVMNITDVGHLSGESDFGEDKMLKGAKREHKSVKEIAKFYTDAFFEDCKALNIDYPDVVEPATNCINDYIKIISKLIEKGFAYLAGGNVYFDTSKLDKYHKFYNFKEEDLEVAVREEVDEDKNKRNKNDFVLWFTKSKFDEQALKWESPWGVGYPGWHIECSGIAIKHLGEYVDIHCGGIGNVFPHHTNEIAQSESYLGHKWCNYWMHILHLHLKNGKMSKSKGEFITVKVLKEKGFSGDEYRFFCLQSHYRNQLMFSYDILENSANAFRKLKAKILKLTNNGNFEANKFNNYKNEFIECLNNDLNTAKAIAVLHKLIKDEDVNDFTKKKLFEDFDEVLSLNLLKGENNCEKDLNDKGLSEEEILSKIEERNNAKTNKNYKLADSIRDELLQKKIKLIDTKDGTIYESIK